MTASARSFRAPATWRPDASARLRNAPLPEDSEIYLRLGASADDTAFSIASFLALAIQ